MSTLNKKDIIDKIAEKSGSTKKDAETALGAFQSVVEEALIAGDKVQMVGFGSFEVVGRAERNGVNPATGEAIVIAASKAPKFKPGKALRDSVNV